MSVRFYVLGLVIVMASQIFGSHAEESNSATEPIEFWTEDGGFKFRIESPEATVAAAIDYRILSVDRVVEFPETVEYDGREYTVERIETNSERSDFPSTVIIPNTVKSIGNNAFGNEEGCSVGSAVIGTGIEWIGYQAFYGCSGRIHICAKYPPMLDSMVFYWWYAGNHYDWGYPSIFVPLESIALYRNTEDWKMYAGDIYAIGSFTLSLTNHFFFSDGIEVDSEETAYFTYINDTGSPIQSFECVSSDPEMLSFEVVKVELPSILKVKIKSFSKTGEVLVTAIATMENGETYKNYYPLVIRDSAAIDEVDTPEEIKTEVFDLRGYKVSENIDGVAPGMYIIKRGNTARKIVVR